LRGRGKGMVLECRRRYQSGAFEAIIYSIFLNVKSKSTI
jgi:hypothetical protein